ncbi:MAG: response regulator transcription factor [Nitrospirae bacterium]|nr:response regulator transcription factor [Nitrospirota bacterium]
MPVKVAIGCYNYLFGEGIKKLLDEEKGISVIGIFNESKDLIEITKIAPDIVLIDFNIFRKLPEDFSIDPSIKILLTGDETLYSVSDKRIINLIKKGVVGILPPASDSHLLKKAIKAVSSGELWLDRKTMSNILSSESHLRKGEINLTDTEKEIVSLICQGYRNKEIAQKLDVSEQTVKSHCNRIFKKIGVSDRLQLALYIYKTCPDWYYMKP